MSPPHSVTGCGFPRAGSDLLALQPRQTPKPGPVQPSAGHALCGWAGRLQVTRAEQANCVKPKRHCARDASPSCLFKDIAPETLPAASSPQARPSPRGPSLKPPALLLLLPTSEGASSHVLPQRPRRALLGASRSRPCCRPQLSSSRFLLSQTQPDFGAHRSATNGRVGRIDSDVRVDPPSGQFPARVSVGLSAALVTATAPLFGKLDALDGTRGRFPSFVWFTLVCFLFLCTLWGRFFISCHKFGKTHLLV